MVREQLVAAEKARSQLLEQQGKMAGTGRFAAQLATCCPFDVDTPDELHERVSGPPMFGYIRTTVEPLAKHPSSIR